MEKESDLATLKINYAVLAKKYSLPEFDLLNEEFQIEKVADSETDFLLREIRACISEKFFGYLRFIESILTPTDAPMFVFAIIKTIGIKEKEKLMELYKTIAKLDIDIIALNLDYSEQKEADAIKEYNLLWKDVKKELVQIVETIKKNWDSKVKEDSKGYFG